MEHPPDIDMVGPFNVEDQIRKTMNDCSSDSAANDLMCSRIFRDPRDRRVDLSEKFITQAGPAFLVPDDRTLDVPVG